VEIGVITVILMLSAHVAGHVTNTLTLKSGK
jgi:hypothetical protein